VNTQVFISQGSTQTSIPAAEFTGALSGGNCNLPNYQCFSIHLGEGSGQTLALFPPPTDGSSVYTITVEISLTVSKKEEWREYTGQSFFAIKSSKHTNINQGDINTNSDHALPSLLIVGLATGAFCIIVLLAVVCTATRVVRGET